MSRISRRTSAPGTRLVPRSPRLTRRIRLIRLIRLIKQSDDVNASSVLVAADEVLSAEFDAETVILDLRTGVYYGLEETGARIWELLKCPTSLGALRDALLDEYQVEPRRCERDLAELLRQLLERRLIRVVDDSAVA